MKENFVIELRNDQFNSTHFGKEMYNLIVDEGSHQYNAGEYAALIRQYLEKPENQNSEHITCRVQTSNKMIANALIQQGFMLADTLVTYCFTFGKSKLPEMTHKVELADCDENDIIQLKQIAKNSFKIDRFHSDESLPNDLCDTYYEKWIENSYNGYADKVVVARYLGEAVGFTTGKSYPDDHYVHLVLSAVSETHRGLGIYTSMIHEGVKWAIDGFSHKATGLLVGTQIDNFPVQKAWINLGFNIFSSHYVFQKTK